MLKVISWIKNKRRKRIYDLLKEAKAMALSYVLGQLETVVSGNDAIYRTTVTIVDDLGKPVYEESIQARVNNNRVDKLDIAKSQLVQRSEEVMAQAAADRALGIDSANLREDVLVELSK